MLRRITDSLVVPMARHDRGGEMLYLQDEGLTYPSTRHNKEGKNRVDRLTIESYSFIDTLSPPLYTSNNQGGQHELSE